MRLVRDAFVIDYLEGGGRRALHGVNGCATVIATSARNAASPQEHLSHSTTTKGKSDDHAADDKSPNNQSINTTLKLLHALSKKQALIKLYLTIFLRVQKMKDITKSACVYLRIVA